MMSSDHPTDILQYPPIICPLPRRTHSYPYPSPYHQQYHSNKHPSHHRHQSRSRISTPHTSRPSSRIHNLSPNPSDHQSNLNSNEDLKSTRSDSPPIFTRSASLQLNSSFDLDSKLAPEDDVLSEFLSLFIPSSPHIVHSITPTSSPTNLIKSTPQPYQRRSVTGHRPRSRLAGSHLNIESEPSKRYNWLIASPISRCHNPLPQHSNLDLLASKLADPIQGLVLTDRQVDQEDRKLSSPVMIS
ncbi:uncharacterized protein MELLADRAFT_116388 [Melampsora larici-populina 98AG31]|uniref:Uncharacterized protein n=1 Tax=Melampsora larici-populina (strain 98AG31 / pathotype 3-4-7) TaxID=747676 RepID=F4RKP4_MELLP|nr:uncharacterized protein MELLADRAFT_116388 [Melampsora larici-populina 98AG31]EGG07141.1 hypothetical protein MELLADRAFT_116388 [Melampsora larici-populina 98AG31]